MKKFPKINQFRQVVKSLQLQQSYVGKDEEGRPIYEKPEEYQPVTFWGFPKLHGSNGSVRLNFETKKWSAYSRTQELSEEKDNAGFYSFVKERIEEIFAWADAYRTEYNKKEIIIFGEWCGGNIQKGVALNQLPKMFVAFAVADAEGEWLPVILPLDTNFNLYSIRKHDGIKIELDLNFPQKIVNKLIKITEEVENECPFAKLFGVSGIGEGYVYSKNGFDFDTAFKVKGEKHSKTKVKKSPTVDIEKVNSINEFLDRNLTEERLEQGWSFVSENGTPEDLSGVGDFIRWINNDIWEEEGDEAEANNISRKDLGSNMSSRCVKWYKEKLYK